MRKILSMNKKADTMGVKEIIYIIIGILVVISVIALLSGMPIKMMLKNLLPDLNRNSTEKYDEINGEDEEIIFDQTTGVGSADGSFASLHVNDNGGWTIDKNSLKIYKDGVNKNLFFGKVDVNHDLATVRSANYFIYDVLNRKVGYVELSGNIVVANWVKQEERGTGFFYFNHTSAMELENFLYLNNSYSFVKRDSPYFDSGKFYFNGMGNLWPGTDFSHLEFQRMDSHEKKKGIILRSPNKGKRVGIITSAGFVVLIERLYFRDGEMNKNEGEGTGLYFTRLSGCVIIDPKGPLNKEKGCVKMNIVFNNYDSLWNSVYR